MFPLFHFAIPLLSVVLIESIIKNKRKKNRVEYENPNNINIILLLIGSMLPDIIDKPLAIIFNLSGRGVGHFLIMIAIISSIIALIFWNKIQGVSIFIGMIFHLILDIPAVPWFGPFVYYEFAQINIYDNLIEHWIFSLLNDPNVYITELLGLFILTTIFLSKKLYIRKNLINFLK